MSDSRPPASLSAALGHAIEPGWSWLPGISGGAWFTQRGSASPVVARPASDREVAASKAAAAAGVGPTVVASLEGWLVVEHLTGRHLSPLDLSRPTEQAALAALLHRWHLAAVTLPEAPLAPLRAQYLDAIPADTLPHGLSLASSRATEIETRLERASRHRVPAHLDVIANVLATPRGLRLIDFEYAAAADPARELGQVVWEAELDAAGMRRLLHGYGSGKHTSSDHVDEAAVAAWAWISGVTWTLWALSRQDGPFLRQYGRRSWERLQGYWARPVV